jgi:hypothetical protein
MVRVPVAPDEVDGVIGQDVGGVPVDDRRSGVADPERGVDLGHLFVLAADPLVPAGLRRARFAVQVLAVEHRAVAGLVQRLHECGPGEGGVVERPEVRVDDGQHSELFT